VAVSAQSKPYGRRLLVYNAVCMALTGLFGAAWGQAASRLIVLGDSLTAGFGLPGNQAFPMQLQAALRARGRPVEVINAGVSGDTSAGGLARLDWVLRQADARFAIVQLGANDALRGLTPAQMDRNLDTIVARLRAREIRVLLTGMLAPPNLGREYGEEFRAVFQRIAERHGVALYPFFLDGVAADPRLNQADGIHPNANGVEVIVQRILPFVERLLGDG
jgi:acyl-CoA thioesterase I